MKKQTWQQWVRAVERDKKIDPGHPSKLYKGCLAALTGTDARALTAFVACLELYSYAGHPEQTLQAARLVLGEMQEGTLWIARELVPFVLNWEDRDRLWPRVLPLRKGAQWHLEGDREAVGP